MCFRSICITPFFLDVELVIFLFSLQVWEPDVCKSATSMALEAGFRFIWSSTLATCCRKSIYQGSNSYKWLKPLRRGLKLETTMVMSSKQQPLALLFTCYKLYIRTVDGSEIPNNHPTCMFHPFSPCKQYS